MISNVLILDHSRLDSPIPESLVKVLDYIIIKYANNEYIVFKDRSGLTSRGSVYSKKQIQEFSKKWRMLDV